MCFDHIPPQFQLLIYSLPSSIRLLIYYTSENLLSLHPHAISAVAVVMCVSVWHILMSADHLHTWCPGRPKEGIRSSGTGMAGRVLWN